VLADILLFTATSLTNDFRSPPLVISNSEDEGVIAPATATLVTSTRPVETPIELPIRMDTWAEHVTMRMRPARTEAVMFDRREVTEFLDKYNRQANNALLTDR
jgi:hypothetical protein